ncbi:MAG: methylmalonyl-CoA mutase small subunit [Micropruina sp.]
MTDTPLLLAGDFAVPSDRDWETEVLKVLNRKRPEGKELSLDQAMKRLRTTTVDGLTIQPLYTTGPQELGHPGVMPFTRGASLPTGAPVAWDVNQLIEDPDPTTANASALTDLRNGATSLWLRVGSDAVAPDHVAFVLAGVKPELAPLQVSSSEDQAAAAEALLAVWRAAGVAAQARGNLGLDPLGLAAFTGDAADFGPLTHYADIARSEFPQVRAVVVDATVYDRAGASDTDELAFAIATGVEYLRALMAAGFTADEAAAQILFRVSARADQFLTIARLRALRRLWARVCQVVGVAAANSGALQQAVSSWRMMTRDDPWVNLLRGTIATFGAAVGGADSITTLPFDAVVGLPDEFSRRMARNTQLLAGEESNVGRVADPAGGSWYVEDLTAQLAVRAWAQFQSLEATGGMGAALASGAITTALGVTNTDRAKQIATRKQPITGVSMFPLKDEEPLAVRQRPHPPARSGLAFVRDSEVFEALRDRAAAAKPRIALACLGARRDFGPREQFTSNVLLAGGIDYVESEGGTAAEIVAQVQDAGARMVILCSSAKVYAAQANDVAGALKDAGIPTVFMAGRRSEVGADAPNIDGEIFDGMDVVAFLDATLERLGAAK